MYLHLNKFELLLTMPIFMCALSKLEMAYLAHTSTATPRPCPRQSSSFHRPVTY